MVSLAFFSQWSAETSGARPPVAARPVGELKVGVTARRTGAATSAARAAEAFNRIPLTFESNDGQAAENVKFISRGRGFNLFLTPREAVLSLRRAGGGKAGEARASAESSTQGPTSAALRMRLVGTRRRPAATGLAQTSWKTNYLIGDDPARWRTNVPTYAKVLYEQVYAGVDLIYYGNQQQLEYDFRLAAGADPRKIRMAFEGADRLEISKEGDLLLHIDGGLVRQHKPVAYQETEGGRREVEGRYRLIGKNGVGFQVSEYDPTKPLVIDPILSYSTYLGGLNSDYSYGLAVDADGNAYVAGTTGSADFPVTAGAYGGTARGSDDIFVFKLNQTGTALIYSTYIGGISTDWGTNITVDADGNAYVAGTTASSNFPVTAGAYQTSKNTDYDGFVTKLNATGTGLVYSTYIGSSTQDWIHDLALDSFGNVYITGQTWSSSFPVTAGVVQQVYGGGGGDAFVTKLNAAGSALVFSTYIGGSGQDYGHRIALGPAGDIYVLAATSSNNLTTTAGAYQATHPGGNDLYITRLDSSATSYIYATYLGGAAGSDYPGAITTDAAGNAYVCGYTEAADFPLVSAAQPSFGGGYNDAFVTKLNPAGTGADYSTYLGGDGTDFAADIKVDSAGVAYVLGHTTSTDFTTTADAFQRVKQGTWDEDGFLTTLDATGSSISFSTYFGGTGQDLPSRLVLGGPGVAYVLGYSNATDFPVTAGAAQETNHSLQGGYPDNFVLKLTDLGGSSGLSISGRLADGDGNGFGGVQVFLTGSQSRVVVTDASGNYVIGGLTPGENYTVTPTSERYSFAPLNQTFNNLGANQTADFTGTARAYAISGRVTDQSGAGMNLITVTVEDFDANTVGTAQTDANGDYSIANVPAGADYIITPSKASFSFTPRSDFTHLVGDTTKNFVGAPTVTISGKVTTSGGGLAGVTMTLVADGALTTQTALTDADGNYSLAGVAQGDDYTLTPSKVGYDFNPTNRVFTNLSGNQTADFTELVTYTISGQVKDQSGAGLQARIMLSGSQDVDTTTDPAGNYAFPAVWGGSYTVTPSKPGYTFTPASAAFNSIGANQTANFTAQLIPPPANDNFGAAQTLSGTSGSLTGTNLGATHEASEPDHAGTGGSSVWYHWTPAWNGSATINTAGSDFDTVLAVYTGASVNSLTEVESNDDDPSGGIVTSSVTFDVVAGNTYYVAVDGFQSDQGAVALAWSLSATTHTISGTMTLAGSPLAGVTLTLSGSASATATTDATGTYSFTVNGGGNYTVTPSKTHYSFSPASASYTTLSGDQTFNAAATLLTHNISGRVTDNYSAPLVGATLTLSGTASATVTTDSGGNYSFESLAAGGSYTVTAAKTDYTFAASPQTYSSLSANQTANYTATPIPGTVQFSQASYSATEGGGSVLIVVTRTSHSAGAATVSYSTAAGGTATAGSDYTATSGTLSFADGETSKSFSLTVANDTLDEDDETVSVLLDAASGALLGPQSTATITILDDEPPPSVAVADAAVTEGSSGTTNASFAVTLSAPSAKTVTVSYATADDTAAAPADYTAVSGTLTFNPGETAKTLLVAVNGDTAGEADEQFFLNLSAATNATVSRTRGVCTITDDEAGSFSFERAEYSAAEDAGAVTVTVIRAGGSAGAVTVSYATNDDTASAGSDYAAASGTLSFAKGEISKTFQVRVADDTVFEGNETLGLTLRDPAGGATLAAPSGAVLTITDNEQQPSLTIADVTVDEGNAGTTEAIFDIILSVPSSREVTVNFATADVTAAAGLDYVSNSGSLRFAPGETRKTVSVTVLGDIIVEGQEAFTVTLSGAEGAGLARVSATASVTDNAAPLLLTEGGTGRAAALDAVVLTREPFAPVSLSNLSLDHGTRIILFVANARLQAGEDSAAVTVTGEDPSLRVYSLPVESAGAVPGLGWLTQVVVRLPESFDGAFDLQLCVRVHGAESNKAPVAVRP